MHTSTIDQYALLRCCPQLIQEILNLLGQAWYLGKNKRGENEREREGGREGGRESRGREGEGKGERERGRGGESESRGREGEGKGERERVSRSINFLSTPRYCSVIGDV